jgi:release factor glutamine methyltransferase
LFEKGGFKVTVVKPPCIRSESIEKRAKILLQRHRENLNSYHVDFNGIKLLMTPNVLCPTYTDGSQLLAGTLAAVVSDTDVVLDMGAGSGVMAVIAARICQQVVSVDISPLATKCVQDNIALNHISHKVDVRLGDLFDAVNLEEKFSLIVFNPPFMDGTPSDWLEAAMYDKDYQTLKRFFAGVKHYLKPGGSVLLVFSEAGDVQLLEELIDESGMKSEVINRKLFDEYDLNSYVFKLSPG